MSKRVLATVVVVLFSGYAWGQSSPGWITGQVPTALEWNTAFSSKQDYAGSVPSPLNIFGSSTGMVSIAAQPMAGTYNFNLPTAPGAPGQFLISGGGGVTPMSWSDIIFLQAGTNAATRTMQNKARETISIRDFQNTGGAAVCAGNDAVDDSVAINRAIAYAASISGGDVLFPAGTDCRIKSPINATSGVHLIGQKQLTPQAFASSVIQPSINMAALILQPALNSPIRDFGIDGLSLYGRKPTYSVTNLVRVSAYNSFIKNSVITSGTGTCVRWDVNPLYAWINHIESNSIGSCDGYSLVFSGSDSWIVNNEIGGSTQGNLFVISSGGSVISNNRIEVSPGYGMIFHTPDAGDGNCMGGNNTVANVVTGNIIEMHTYGILYQKGSCAGNAKASDIVAGNVFIGNSMRDIQVDAGITNGHIGPNNHNASLPSASYLGFIPGTGNTGWTFSGTVGTSTLVENEPVSLQKDINGDQVSFKRADGVFTGSVQAGSFAGPTGIIRFNGYGAGTLQTDASGNISTTSDESLKDIVGPFTRGLEDLLKIDVPVNFHWRPESGMETAGVYSGFTAQGVAKGIPEAVSERDGLLSLSDRPIIAALINAVKELKADNDNLRDEVQQLKRARGRSKSKSL